MKARHGETVARAAQRSDRIADAYARGYATARDLREAERLLDVAIRRTAEAQTCRHRQYYTINAGPGQHRCLTCGYQFSR